jgi:lipoprotein-releasing system ATP-binding protein
MSGPILAPQGAPISGGSAASIILEARGLKRELGQKVKQVVLQGIDLVVERGEFVALTGHSGSGKSTLLYLLGALDRPTAGQVIIDGVDASALDDDARGELRNVKLGFVFQFHFLLAEFTALENVMIPMLRRGVPDEEARERAAKTISDLGLTDLLKRRPGEMSGGQQQRISIARALANRPAIVLADEPTGNLDSKNGDLVMDLFDTVNRQLKTTLIMVTHDQTFAERATRQVMLKDGRVLSDRRRAEVPTQPTLPKWVDEKTEPFDVRR